jgi:hypothetical protein
MSELLRNPDEAEFFDDLSEISDAAIARRYIVNEVMQKIAKGEHLTPVDLDVCTLLSPYELVCLFDDKAMDDENIQILFDNTEQDPELVDWTRLALQNGIHDLMVVPYEPGAQVIVGLEDAYDTPERIRLLGLESSTIEELLMQIIRRIWLGQINMTWSRLLAREALEGTDKEISTQEIAVTFSQYSSQADPNSILVLEKTIYKSKEPDNETPVEVVVHVPVAAGQERDTLPKLIDNLARQSIDPKKIKTYIVHNRRKASYDDAHYEEDDHEEIEWMRDFYTEIVGKYPHYKFEAIYIVGEPALTIGHIRRKSHLYAINKYTLNNAKNNPLMINLDADTSQMNTDFMQSLLDTAESTGRPVTATRLKWKTSEVFREAPTVAKLLKLSMFLSAVAEADRGTPTFYDCGTAIRLREYCLSGGHIWHDVFYETGGVVHAVKLFAEHDGNLGSVVSVSKNSRFKSDPRRQLFTLHKKSAPERAWDPEITTFGEHNDTVRGQSINLAELESQTVSLLGELIADMIEINIGWFHGATSENTNGREGFIRKQDVISKGLRLLGLPDLSELA